jgi:hypothetical protein
VDVETLMTSKILLYDLGLAKYWIKPMGLKNGFFGGRFGFRSPKKHLI